MNSAFSYCSKHDKFAIYINLVCLPSNYTNFRCFWNDQQQKTSQTSTALKTFAATWFVTFDKKSKNRRQHDLQMLCSSLCALHSTKCIAYFIPIAATPSQNYVIQLMLPRAQPHHMFRRRLRVLFAFAYLFIHMRHVLMWIEGRCASVITVFCDSGREEKQRTIQTHSCVVVGWWRRKLRGNSKHT